ncbi:hypothetical protein EBESD8_44820 [Rhodococcus aetherivorans]|nr:hypothetical protein EBESD8_44820 [Rhodococcus aetherivorans]
MPEYGRKLLFGIFLTPAAENPAAVVDLAVASERAGLDLVTFQDHPYQARFLDAWTLLTWVAARTTRVLVAPNVANLPLRGPAILARSAASLDRLSGGRVELGLGAGAYWDAIAANGGPHRTTGEAVDALEEAITVIRELWADRRGGARVDGTHYRLAGAKRGPAPAHDIGIWLGAYGPRMLALTGRPPTGGCPARSPLRRTGSPRCRGGSTRRLWTPAGTRARSAGSTTSAADSTAVRTAGSSPGRPPCGRSSSRS